MRCDVEKRPRVRVRRQRTVTGGQRLAANSRERRRMSLLNTAFDALRSRVPVFAYERRPSRCDTLRLAARYIAVMTELLASLGHTPTSSVDTDTITSSSSLLSRLTHAERYWCTDPSPGCCDWAQTSNDDIRRQWFNSLWLSAYNSPLFCYSTHHAETPEMTRRLGLHLSR